MDPNSSMGSATEPVESVAERAELSSPHVNSSRNGNLNNSDDVPSSSGSDCAENSREEELSRLWKRSNKNVNDFLMREMMVNGKTPHEILNSLLPGYNIAPSLPEEVVCRIIVELLEERAFRTRLPQYHDFRHAVELFRNAKRILIITGAGVSVSCGIPDFRSATGIYATLKKTYPDLPRPTSMFDIQYFRKRPEPFFSFAKEIFPGQYKPSLCHMFIKFLEEENKLLRNYTQNIDTLERVAGISRVVECHGSFAQATCIKCKAKYTSDDIRAQVYDQKVALCKSCGDGVIKPNIVFFGEDLPDHFHIQMGEDRDKADLVVVIGSSLRVQPVSLIPHHVDENIPQILINRENLRSYDADVKLLGDCDEIVFALAMALGGSIREKMIADMEGRDKFANSLPVIEAILAEEANGSAFVPKVLTVEEFRDLYIPSEAKEDEEVVDEDHPSCKKMRLDVPEVDKATSSNAADDKDVTQGKTTTMKGMWEARYVSVASKLDGVMYAKFPPNLNIFKGADFYYDADDKTFCALPARQDVDDGEYSSSSSDSEDESTPHTKSLPDECTQNEYREISVSERSFNSCPDDFFDDSENSNDKDTIADPNDGSP